jgi:HSP90 family molecular chaperone
VSKSPSQREQAVLNELAVVLRKENCTGNFFEGDDVEEIARLELNTLESIQRFLQIRESGDTGSKILLLNRLHPIVSQMIDGAAGQNHLHAWLRVLYHLALLQAREVPTLGETRRFSHSLGNIFTTSTLNSL